MAGLEAAVPGCAQRRAVELRGPSWWLQLLTGRGDPCQSLPTWDILYDSS